MDIKMLWEKYKVSDFLKRNALLLVFAGICLVFTIATDSFLTIGNLVDIFRSLSISGLIAVGLTYVILSGGIDLSVAGVLGLAGAVAALLSFQPLLAVIAGLAVGLAIGLFNGFIIVKTRVQPFILTLGVGVLVKGIILALTRGISIYNVSEEFREIGKGELAFIPVPIWIFIAIFALTYIALNKSKFGRYVYSVGSNEDGARLSGIKTDKTKIMVYVISGLLAALAGIVLTARVGAAEPTAASGWELDAVAAVIIGGTSLRGGQGGIFYTLLGIFLMGVLNNGMILLNVPSHYYQVVKGALIVMAVLVDRNKGKL